MPDNSNETNDFLTKAAIYAVGTMLGVAAKLATMNQEQKITRKQIVFHSVVAFATAWCVWWTLKDSMDSNTVLAASVVVGRFGDVILIAIGKAIKQWIMSTINKDL